MPTNIFFLLTETMNGSTSKNPHLSMYVVHRTHARAPRHSNTYIKTGTICGLLLFNKRIINIHPLDCGCRMTDDEKELREHFLYPQTVNCMHTLRLQLSTFAIKMFPNFVLWLAPHFPLLQSQKNTKCKEQIKSHGIRADNKQNMYEIVIKS